MPNDTPLTDAAIHKELDLIQDIIKRMAANSFQVKTWMMAIVTAILAFKHEEIFSGGTSCNHAGVWISLVLLFPVLMFWYLDAFFLRTERQYRRLYHWVVTNRPFTKAYLYDLNTFIREDFTASPLPPAANLLVGIADIAGIMFSKTLRWFYAIPLVLVLTLILYNITL